ncbi:MAG: type III secretion system export apparatus subunit SctT [Janthinobacterium lividum]
MNPTLDAATWGMPELIALGYAMPRLFAMLSIMPIFTQQTLPPLLRAGVAFCFAIFVVPLLVGPANAVERQGFELLALIAKEAVLGFFMGFIISLPIWAFEIMGDLIDNQRGASIAQTLSPMTGHDTSPLGDLFAQATVVFLFITGGFLLIMAALLDSYRIYPVFEWLPRFSNATPAYLLGLFDGMLRLAVLMGAPIIISMFLAELGLALVSLFAPQLQVFFLAMPVKSGLAMFVFAVYVGTLFDFAGNQLADIGQRMLGSIDAVFPRGAR